MSDKELDYDFVDKNNFSFGLVQAHTSVRNIFCISLVFLFNDDDNRGFIEFSM